MTNDEYNEKLEQDVQRVRYRAAVERGLEGLTAVSTGLCPGCEECADNHGYESIDEFDAAYESGEACDEGHFSWGSCGICGSHLGGTRYAWHAIEGKDGDDVRGKPVLHFDDACEDCVLYLANGDEPETWEG